MTTKPRWTNDEEQVVIAKVRQHPNNLKQAFREASEEIGRTEYAITRQWYVKIRHSETVFMTVGPKTINRNTKNIYQGSSNNTERANVSIWRRILKLLGL